MTRGGLRPLRTLMLSVVLLAAPGSAAADWQFTPFIGWTFKGSTTLSEIEVGAAHLGHWNFGGAVTVIGRGPLGGEAYVVYTPGFFNRSDPPPLGAPVAFGVKASRSYALMGNIVVATPLSWNEYGLRPFVSGGLGLLHATQIDENEIDVFTFRRNILAYNIGGGAVGFLSDRTGVRFDLRYIRNLRNEEDPLAVDPVTASQQRRLHYWTAAIGVVLKY
jgi:hypothetical protein